ncbi:unnamed protein product, partial [Staurois parvus]
NCDCSQLVTWYKAVVNGPVPCDLYDHSQISHVVNTDVRSDILLITIHVITDWLISDHMIGTSHTEVLYTIEKYRASCDWSQLVTWYKAVVNSPVPCDLCDHSQISHV